MAKTPAKTNGSEDLLSTADVAAQYGVSDETVRRWIRKGVISYVMVGPFRLKRVPRAEVERKLESRA
jgi:excisionase family DNA binding protein